MLVHNNSKFHQIVSCNIYHRLWQEYCIQDWGLGSVWEYTGHRIHHHTFDNDAGKTKGIQRCAVRSGFDGRKSSKIVTGGKNAAWIELVIIVCQKPRHFHGCPWWHWTLRNKCTYKLSQMRIIDDITIWSLFHFGQALANFWIRPCWAYNAASLYLYECHF